MRRNQNFGREDGLHVAMSLGSSIFVFVFVFFFSPFLFAAVIGLLLGLLAVKKNF